MQAATPVLSFLLASDMLSFANIHAGGGVDFGS
jgi:hypothetical protein